MAVQFRCHKCDKLISMLGEPGAEVTCPRCHQKTTIPAPVTGSHPYIPPAQKSTSTDVAGPVAVADTARLEGDVSVRAEYLAILGGIAPWAISLALHVVVLLVLALLAVLVVRETPLHKGHLRLLSQAADTGAHILPPIPAFYSRPKTIDDLIDQTIGKVFDLLGIPHDLFKRWGDNME